MPGGRCCPPRRKLTVHAFLRNTTHNGRTSSCNVTSFQAEQTRLNLLSSTPLRPPPSFLPAHPSCSLHASIQHSRTSMKHMLPSSITSTVFATCSIRKHAMGSVCMRLSVLQPSARGMGTATLTSASKYADKREHPSPTVNVSGGSVQSPFFANCGYQSPYCPQDMYYKSPLTLTADGTITSTSELDSEQYNLLDAGPTACHSLLDPKYHAGSSAKAFAGALDSKLYASMSSNTKLC